MVPNSMDVEEEEKDEDEMRKDFNPEFIILFYRSIYLSQYCTIN
jgi:uncharacterized protein (DUF608 family)